MFQVLTGRIDLHQQPGLACIFSAWRIDDNQIGPQGFVMFRDNRLQGLLNALAFDNYFVWQF